MVSHYRRTPTKYPYLWFVWSLQDSEYPGLKFFGYRFYSQVGGVGNKVLKEVFSSLPKKWREIQTFQQKDGDLFFEALEHFNELLLKCTDHNLSQDNQVQGSYEGLNDTNKSLVDLACGGVHMEKNSEEAIELFETLSKNSQQFAYRGRQGLRGKGAYEVNTNGGIQTQMATMERTQDMLVKAMTWLLLALEEAKEIGGVGRAIGEGSEWVLDRGILIIDHCWDLCVYLRRWTSKFFIYTQ